MRRLRPALAGAATVPALRAPGAGVAEISVLRALVVEAPAGFGAPAAA